MSILPDPSFGSPTRSCRGQEGVTVIELLIVILVGTILLLPVYGLINLTLNRRGPAVAAAESSKQLRLFRTLIAQDWATAEVIKIGTPGDRGGTLTTFFVGAVECKGGDMTADLTANTFQIAIQNSNRIKKQLRRIIYNKRFTISTTDDPTAIEILRRECDHPNVPGWGQGGSIGVGETGAQSVVVTGIKDLIIPATCNLTGPPYLPCDMNITAIGLDGQKASIRLHQHIGRDS